MNTVVEHDAAVSVIAGPDAAQQFPATQGVVERLQARAERVEPWHIAVLRAIGEWELPDEVMSGRRWHYIIGGEALDWLTLAERLCAGHTRRRPTP